VQTASALDILLVDDDGPLRDMLSRSFEREGHRVTAVADGEAALRAAGDQPFDVVLLDVALGEGPTGHDVARLLRRRRDVVPIIMLTALDSEADAVQGLEAGADDYVTKPFGIGELLARVRVALRHGRGPDRPQVIEAGEVRIDLAGSTVTRSGEPVHLTRLEYRLLEALAVNAGRICTHRYLLERVWGPGYGDASQYLRVYVANLRRKLDDPAAPRLILTEPGMGYRLTGA
jgi:DNA-binding response OmpR family regulator